MRITEGINFQTKDDTFTQVEQVFARFAAGDAIPVGSVVMLDTSTAGGYTVVIAAASTDLFKVVGIYTGADGTGSGPPVSPLSGKAAVSGDAIEVQIYGVAEALVDGTTDVALDDVLTTGASGYLYQFDISTSTEVTAAGDPWPGTIPGIIALEAETDTIAAQTTAGDVGTKVFLRLM